MEGAWGLGTVDLQEYEYHSVLLASSPANQQYFSLTSNQHQPPVSEQ